MIRKLAIKRLTASDLTFFEYHFRHNPAGNQKGVNLNADPFVTRLYPGLPSFARDLGGRIPIDLYIYGPGLHGECNLQRKIIKRPEQGYKNWRLDGEFVTDTACGPPGRLHSLAPGDIAVFEFLGDAYPTAIRLVLLSANVTEDARLHQVFDEWLGTRRMATISSAEVDRLVARAAPHNSHPVRVVVIDADLEDAALGGEVGRNRLRERSHARRLTPEDLERARRNASIVGHLGENLVNDYFSHLKETGQIEECEWVSQTDTTSPFDFRMRSSEGSTVLIDVKSTHGAFERRLHLSVSELREAARGEYQYDIYRVYDISETRARMRIAPNIGQFASRILAVLEQLPGSVQADSISVDPQDLPFLEEEIALELRESGGEDEEEG